jgi:diguanylate cyclase (GGDEF)-like protein/PAS domain S-box-containing protein
VEAHPRPTLDADRLADVLDGVSVCVFVKDLEGRFVYVNRAVCALFEVERAALLGSRPEDVVGEEAVAEWHEQDRQVLEQRRPLDIEETVRGRVFVTHKVPLYGPDAEPVAVIGVSTDITERKRSEDALRRSEARLTEAQQIAGVGSWHWDAESEEVAWSAELLRMCGIEPGAEPRGRDALSLVHPEDRDGVVDAVRCVMREGGTTELELRIRRSDGEDRHVLVRAGATPGREGAQRRLDGVCEDVTERRRAEARLGEAQRLAQLGWWDWDLDRDEVTLSAEAYRILGVEPEEFSPSRASLIGALVPEDQPLVAAAADAVLAGEAVFDQFVRLRRPDGAVRELRLRGSRTSPAGVPGAHLLGICQDLTDLHATEQARAEAVERFRTVFERAPVGMALIGRGGRFEHVNEAMAEFLGRDVATLLESTVADVTHPEDLEESRAAIRAMTSHEIEEWNTEKRYVRPGGEVRWGTLRALLVHDAEGRPAQGLALVLDITDQRLAEHRRAAVHGVLGVMAGGAPLHEALPALVEALVRDLDWVRGSLWLRDDEGTVRCEAQWPPDSAAEQPPAIPDDPVARPQGLVLPVVSGPDELGVLELDCEGTEQLGEHLAGFAKALGAQIGEFVVRKRAEEQLLHHALHDPLTGLPNRVLFFDRLDHALRRQQREHSPLAVMFVDFDGFKAVNDRFGQAGGDEVLRLTAAGVASTLRAEDTVARFGGDELVVLSEHLTGAEHVGAIAERILAQLRRPIEVEGQEVVLTASIGICVAPVAGPSRDALLRRADAAMYQAKAGGPGRYVIAD